MNVRYFLLAVILFSVISGCGVTSLFNPKEYKMTPTTFEKQPEPSEPQLSISASGVTKDALVMVRIYTLDGRQIQWGTFLGRDTGVFVITDVNGLDYVITAEADGFVSKPKSYTIHLDKGTISLMENDEAIAKDISHLNFFLSH